MDPLSIISGCAGLITAIGSLSVSINTFVRSCREARSDLDRVSRELHSLQTVLELIEEDAKDDTKPFPPTIQHHVSGIVTNCGSVVLEVETCIRKYGDGRIKSKAAWAINGQGDMEKLRSSLEAHKSALELALDMLSLSLTKDIKTDTSEIRNDTAAIKDDTALILQEIAELQARLPDSAAAQNDYILQRFLEDMATYTETTLDANVSYRDGMSSRDLSMIDEHDECSLESLQHDLSILVPQQRMFVEATRLSDLGDSFQKAGKDLVYPRPQDHSRLQYPVSTMEDIPDRPKGPGPESLRTKGFSNREESHILRFRGNVVLDIPVPDRILAHVPHSHPPDRDEFTHSRFSFITCPPERFGDQDYTLRATLFAKPRHTQFILVVQVNPDDKDFIRRWDLIHDSIIFTQKKLEMFGDSDEFWKRVVVHLHLAHGIEWGPRGTDHPLSVLESIGANQTISGKITKIDHEDLDEPVEKDSSAIGRHKVYATMSEYTVQLRQLEDLPGALVRAGVPIQVVITTERSPESSMYFHPPRKYVPWTCAINNVLQAEHIIDISEAYWGFPEIQSFMWEVLRSDRQSVSLKYNPFFDSYLEVFNFDRLMFRIWIDNTDMERKPKKRWIKWLK